MGDEVPAPQLYRCGQVGCRVQTFLGGPTLPLNTCPVCIAPGWMEPRRG